MKKKVQRIIFPALLILNLLFGQVALNFLHSSHSEHEPDVKSQSDKASVHRHGEHCKVCSLDIVLNLHAEPSSFNIIEIFAEIISTPLVSVSECLPIFSLSDRAPPAGA